MPLASVIMGPHPLSQPPLCTGEDIVNTPLVIEVFIEPEPETVKVALQLGTFQLVPSMAVILEILVSHPLVHSPLHRTREEFVSIFSILSELI
jgi:hypothetical protein